MVVDCLPVEVVNVSRAITNVMALLIVPTDPTNKAAVCIKQNIFIN